MKVEPTKITVRDLVKDYHDDGAGGVVGYGGTLDIRPPFQREFVYTGKQRDAVMETINKGFPLNVMYWSARNDRTYEIIDGQQRTISIAQYVKGDYSVDGLYFDNLQDDEQRRILGYQLDVYVCDGTASEKLAWFKIINIAGERLTRQELRNAVYAGSWLSDAKRHFSRTGCAAYKIGSAYVRGKPVRQDYLETAIKWISRGKIDEYMGQHQHDSDATEVWRHFRSVIEWVESCFKTRPKLMRGVDWGSLYSDYRDAPIDRKQIEAETKRLIADDDVKRQSGIYAYVLTGDERHLKIRAFSQTMKQRAYESQDGRCAMCGEQFKLSQMEADHRTPWSRGGPTVQANCQMLCRDCNRRKGAR